GLSAILITYLSPQLAAMYHSVLKVTGGNGNKKRLMIHKQTDESTCSEVIDFKQCSHHLILGSYTRPTWASA
ncbi:hypothetical protein BDR05DRAFT_958879, partial [Suillus weaverae]